MIEKNGVERSSKTLASNLAEDIMDRSATTVLGSGSSLERDPSASSLTMVLIQYVFFVKEEHYLG